MQKYSEALIGFDRAVAIRHAGREGEMGRGRSMTFAPIVRTRSRTAASDSPASIHFPDRGVEHGGVGDPCQVGQEQRPGEPVDAPEGGGGGGDCRPEQDNVEQRQAYLSASEKQNGPQQI